MELEAGITAIDGFSIALLSLKQVDKVQVNITITNTLNEVNKILPENNCLEPVTNIFFIIQGFKF
jgi:hypothetical protein